jgi:hypothetical protein
MAANARVREERNESLEEHVERHRHLLAVVEAGDREAVLAAFQNHGDRSLIEEMAPSLTAYPMVEFGAGWNRSTGSGHREGGSRPSGHTSLRRVT